MFLREAWRQVLDENDHSWIENKINDPTRDPDAPCAGIGPALQRLLAQGVNPQDLTDVVRVMQYELLFGLCYLLSDPGLQEEEVRNISWSLIQFNKDNQAVAEIAVLHESVLGTDPTGREMRPRR